MQSHGKNRYAEQNAGLGQKRRYINLQPTAVSHLFKSFIQVI